MGNGSGMFYLDKNKGIENGVFKVNFAELKPYELLRQYLLFVMKHLNTSGEYEKQPSKVLADLWGVSEDKIDRIHKKSVESGYLVNELKRIYKINKMKVSEIL